MSSYPGQTHFRWPGMPTSGRYVYKIRDRRDEWYWQCDICGAPRFDEAKTYLDMSSAFRVAHYHASYNCPGYWVEDES